jgi:hypothetical protein
VKIEPPLCVALRCAACGKPFSVPARLLRADLTRLMKAPRPAAALFALLCADCGSGGKSEHDGCVVRIDVGRWTLDVGQGPSR